MFLTFIMTLSLFSSPKPLVGTFDIMHLQHKKKFVWFDDGFSAYQPKTEAINKLKSVDYSHIRIIVFAGTWCSDTKDLLPKFCKMLQCAGINTEICTLHLLDSDKHSPEGTEQNYHITNVPTFIVFENNNEKGRVVESVQKSIEEDLSAILTAK